MPFQVCRHTRTNGRRCQSPSLTGTIWCYFHQPLHTRSPRPRRKIGRTTLHDPASIQAALSSVVNALATHKIDPRRATAILYALQLAGSTAALVACTPATVGVQQGLAPQKIGAKKLRSECATARGPSPTPTRSSPAAST